MNTNCNKVEVCCTDVRHSSIFWLLAGFFLTMMLAIPMAQAGHPGASSGDGIAPMFVEGNPTCSSLGGGYEFKINSPGDGTFTGGNHPDGTLEVTIDVRNTSQGQVFDWEVLNGTVHLLVVKGGPDANKYVYAPPDTEDTGLHSPVNHNNGRYYGLSHISFCYVPGEPSIDVTKTCTQQSVFAATATTINEVIITNDGDFPLTGIQIKEALNTCSLTEVGGDGMDVPLTSGVYMTVPNGGSFDGDLAVDEWVALEITCENSSLNVANTIKAKGTHEAEMVMDMDSSDPLQDSGGACALASIPSIAIDKDCPADDDVRLMGMGGILAVEVCPSIVVTNNGQETLSIVTVSDAAIAALDGSVNYGPLAPGASVDLGTDLALDLCYLPAMPQELTIDDNGTPTDSSDDKYSPSEASFYNEATADALSAFGGVTSASDDTLDEFGDPECPLCAPCPECIEL